MSATPTYSTRSRQTSPRRPTPAQSQTGSNALLVAALTLLATGVSLYDLLLLAVTFH